MKTKRCKYGHKIERKQRTFNSDKFFVLATGAAFVGYTLYLNWIA